MPVTFAEQCSIDRETPILGSCNNERRASTVSIMTICESTAKQLKDNEFSEMVKCELPTYINLGGSEYDDRTNPSLPLSCSTYSKRSSLASLLSVKLFYYSEILANHGKSIIIVILLVFMYASLYSIFMLFNGIYDIDENVSNSTFLA